MHAGGHDDPHVGRWLVRSGPNAPTSRTKETPLRSLTSFSTQFRLFVDHDDMINMTGRKTSATDRLGQIYKLCNFSSLILPSLKSLETIRILMQTLLIMLNADHHKHDGICNAAIA
jgi:hypothetical protein